MFKQKKAAELRKIKLQVLRPQLPDANKLFPYLRRIDESRIYTNYGPLVKEFEERLSRKFQIPPEAVVTTSSGTSALIGAVLGAAGRPHGHRPLAFIPSFTFPATASAVEQCGYTPYIVDVNIRNWLMDPERLARHPMLTKVGLVVPVATFGRPIPQKPWAAFRESTGISVVIDGAASFDGVVKSPQFALGEIPVTFSFHATKCFATGEGGAVVSTNLGLAATMGRALNFGLDDNRDSKLSSTNGKMSEYGAAVGLAELDWWPEKYAALKSVAETYRRLFAEKGLMDRLLATPDVGASYVLLSCKNEGEVERTKSSLLDCGIGFRFWYGRGLHAHSYFSTFPKDDVATTHLLANSLIGLPLAQDLTKQDIARVADAVIKGVSGSQKSVGWTNEVALHE